MAEAGPADAPALGEFALIARHFSQLTPDGEGVVLGIGDDAALLDVSPGHHLVVTSDTLIAGRHFPLQTAPFDIGWKALAVNLSDLAAMGAAPRWFTLALSLPQADMAWLTGFAAGLKALADRYRIALVGGDTTRGALSITITALGEVPVGTALRRDGARLGDWVCVTGTLGDAAAGLTLALQPAFDARASALAASSSFLLSRLNRPEPRVRAGEALRQHAHAAIDLSDGLAGDLQHILEASGVGADLRLPMLPASPALLERFPIPETRFPLQVAGGDDYELCVCLPPDALDAAQAMLDVPLTPIGRITAEPGLRWLDARGAAVELAASAYRHF